jgi:hypothetical protein
MKLAVRLATPLIWQCHAADEAGCTSCDAPNMTMSCDTSSWLNVLRRPKYDIIVRQMKLAVRLATPLIWQYRAADEAGWTSCDAPNMTLTTAISKTFPNVAGLPEMCVCLLFSVAAASRHKDVLQLNPLSRIFHENLITTAQIMSFLSIPHHNTVEHFRRNCKSLFRLKDNIHPHDDNRTLTPMPGVLAPNTLSQE